MFQYYMKKGERYRDMVKGKDILILIGMTGAGKSLTINYLMGLEIIEIKQPGKYPYLDVSDKDKNKGSKVSEGAQSMTEFFHIHTINDDLIVLDTAGFGDSKAAELEIA